jgi:hypothetical protein
VTSIGDSHRDVGSEPRSDEMGGSMERDRWRLIISIAVGASLVLGLVGIGIGVEALRKTKAPPTGPSASVIYPSSGSTVSGTTALDVKPLSPTVTTLNVVATGGSLHDTQIGVATPSLSGWITKWDTTTVSNGTYQIAALAFNQAGRSGRSASIQVIVKN